MENQLNISSSPHIRSKVTSSNIMLMVTIALLPASAFGVYNFGMDALLMLIVTTATAVLTEFIYEKLMHKKITIGDFSAVVTGLLLGLNMPPTAPLWMGALGSVFAILIVKQLFGGLGQNFMNPALGARCFLTHHVNDSVKKNLPSENRTSLKEVLSFFLIRILLCMNCFSYSSLSNNLTLYYKE